MLGICRFRGLTARDLGTFRSRHTLGLSIMDDNDLAIFVLYGVVVTILSFDDKFVNSNSNFVFRKYST